MNNYTKAQLIEIARSHGISYAGKTKEMLYDTLLKQCSGLGFHTNIEKDTVRNKKFKKFVYTVPNSLQLALMSLKPGQDIGWEVHPVTAQFIRIEKGTGKAIIGCEEFALKDGSAIIVPMNTRHNVYNTSATKEMKLYTVYSNDLH